MSDIVRTRLFWQLQLPNEKTAPVLGGIEIALPLLGVIPPERAHLLAYIPWSDRFFGIVPKDYRDFFRFVLPHLGARTTDVHTAFSVSYVAELVAATPEAVNEHVLTLAVILHDSGWPQLAPDQIADSLDYSALAYSDKALKPKEMHATLGAKVAAKLLAEYPGDLNLTDEQQRFICDLVFYHDQVRPWPTTPEPIEYLLLGDADRLWSYTRENFWLDTVRKNVESPRYVQNLEKALDDGFFLTPQGEAIARRLLKERQEEVALFSLESTTEAVV